MPEPQEVSPVWLLLLDEDALFRASLARFLSWERDFQVAKECGTAADALEFLKGSTVDLVLIDYDLDSGGNAFLSAAHAAGYQGRFLMVAGVADVKEERERKGGSWYFGWPDEQKNR